MEIALVLLIVLVAVVLFAWEILPVDLVALSVLAALLLLNIVTIQEGLSGFSNAATVTVACMFILSAGLQKTGALSALGRWLIRLGNNHTALLLVVMLVSGLVSAFINNTAAVAVFLPIVLTVCLKKNISPSLLLIPLSFASQFGGVCTLIGSSTNILINSISKDAGHGAFSMFEFSALGTIMMLAGILYFLFFGKLLLPTRRGKNLTENYELGKYITELRVLEKSPLIDSTISQSKFGEKYDVTILEIIRDKKMLWSSYDEKIKQGDILLVKGKVGDLIELKTVEKLEIEPEFKLQDESLETDDLRLVETLVAPRSRLIGHTLKELDFRYRYNMIVIALQRRAQVLREKLNQVRLEFGDALLLQGPLNSIRNLRRNDNFIVLEEVEEPATFSSKAPLAILIIIAVIFLATAGIMPILVSALLGCVFLTLSGCLSMEEAYSAIDWKVIFLLAGILPLGIALEKVGAAQLLAEHTLHFLGAYGPIAVLAAFYLLTAILTEFMSNNASAVLLAPIAISTAAAMGVDARPFLVAVCFAASTSFSTPVGYQTNTMIYSPGGYKFSDFIRVGVPLNIIFWIIAVIFIPMFWSFELVK